MTMQERVEGYLKVHGETKWIDLAQALGMVDGASMRRLRTALQEMTYTKLVARRVKQGLTYYRLRP